MWRRHGPQCFHMAEREDDSVQLHEAASSSQYANATKYDTSTQQHDVISSASVATARLPTTDTTESQSVDEFATWWHS